MKTQTNSTRASTKLLATIEPSKIVDEHFVCALFNVDSKHLLHANCVRDTKTGNTTIHITLKPTHPPCPTCGSSKSHIKDYYTRVINHSALSNTHTLLHFRDRRYICPYCRKTYFAQNPFIEDCFHHSLLTTKHILEDLKDPNTTMRSVANRYHLSATTIANVFDAHVDIGRKKLSKFLSIDEVYAFKSNKSKYVCVLLDYQRKVPIEILPSRTYDDLRRFFSSIPLEERELVSVFSTDMWDAYRTIAKHYLPNSTIIVDHFHIIQECNKRLDRIRLDIQKSFDRKSDEYYLLKKFHWVLFKNDEALLDSNKKKKYNRKLKRFLNYHDIKCLLQDSHPQLEVAINLKDALCMYYDTIKILEDNIDPTDTMDVPKLKTKYDGSVTQRSRKLHNEAKKYNNKRTMKNEEAMKELEDLIAKYRECTLIEFSSFALTLNKWKEEIVNSLKVYSELDKKTMSNALIENRNKIIKNVKRTSNGYTNWRRFRNRLMYTLDPNSTYFLNPDESMIEAKRKKNRNHYLNWKERNQKN